MWKIFTDERVTEGWYQLIFSGWIPDWFDRRDLPIGKFLYWKGKKTVFIKSIDIIGDQNLVIITIYKWENLVVSLLVAGLLGVLGIFGLWLSLKELRKWTEAVIEKPAGFLLGTLILATILSGFWIFSKKGKLA